MTILKQSLQSLFIEMNINGTPIATGTGFIANSVNGHLLITNRHNVTGRNNITNKVLSDKGFLPDSIKILHNQANKLGSWVWKTEKLYDDHNPLWIEHPTLKDKADMVALPLTQLDEIDLYPHSLGNNDPAILVAPSDAVSVVGFPFGLKGGGGLAIWATGFIASELDVDYDSLPIFLIDCRARTGQSGSPVLAQRNGGMVAMENGDSAMFKSPITKFLGIYSGRINKESDLGIVWKASAIRELVESI